MSRRSIENVTIVGAGPAGLTAALYAARANLEPLVIEGQSAGGPTGGQLVLTTDVENYPGFPDGLLGPDLVAKMRAQAERFGARYVTEDLDAVRLDDRPYGLRTASVDVLSSTIIVATGARPRKLEIPGEDDYWGSGVSACATCDGFLFQDRHVVVVGGGDSAMEEALFLAKFAARVTVVHRRDVLRASPIMQDRAREHQRVSFAWNSVPRRIVSSDGLVAGIDVVDTASGEERTIACDGVFLGIGHIPNTHEFDRLTADEQGYVLVDEPSTATNLPGVFACGDVIDPTYRQAVTAAGTGCRAALDAERYLREFPLPPELHWGVSAIDAA